MTDEILKMTAGLLNNQVLVMPETEENKSRSNSSGVIVTKRTKTRLVSSRKKKQNLADVFRREKRDEEPESSSDPEPDYYLFPKATPAIKRCIKQQIPTLIWGPTGSGKSELVHRIADALDREVFPHNCHQDTYGDDFFGSQELVDGEKGPKTEFSYAALPVAMKAGGVFLVEEVDASPAGALMALQRPLEGKDLYISKTTERVHAEDGFSIVATANTPGIGDETGIYRARQSLDAAFLDRFLAVFHLGYPSIDDETKILTKKTGIARKKAHNIAKVASLARKGFELENVAAAMGLRKTIAWARLMQIGLSRRVAYRAAVLNRLSKNDAVIFDRYYQRVFGESAKND